MYIYIYIYKVLRLFYFVGFTTLSALYVQFLTFWKVSAIYLKDIDKNINFYHTHPYLNNNWSHFENNVFSLIVHICSLSFISRIRQQKNLGRDNGARSLSSILRENKVRSNSSSVCLHSGDSTCT